MKDTLIDVRTLEPYDRHPAIFQTFAVLKRGQALQILNDHDPKPLHRLFEAELAGIYAWEYLESGPIWRVRISKIADSDKIARGRGCGCGAH